MERFIKKLLVITGSLAGIATAMIPLTSYANSDTTKNATKNATVAVTVSPVLTLDVSVDGVAEGGDKQSMAFAEVSSNQVSEGTFTASVSTNAKYTLSLNALDGKVDMLREGETPTAANKIKGDGNVAVGQSSWGVKLAKEGETYSAIPAEPEVFYTSESFGTSENTQFQVGISVGPSLAQGTYSSTLVVTAANI